ncbi:DUF2255 family protein [Mangrovihabitans endophyticus]|uniref:DUF2255 family protein n=1 Tax=Mangrovihabitans endophyticus TaxID=1751298 RepID=A0A8J3BWY3_9ACTN|nr:DUF2255 family protein [Mangrovihabitans endophyticus]GGK75884.1 hypothetical protein GCM10012284_07350 [Mangrovihabitans endophyticus]
MTWDTGIAARLSEAREVDVIVPAPGRAPVRVPVWLVAVGGELYLRSWKGEAGLWYRRALRYGTGALGLDGREHRVRFTAVAEPALDAGIDRAYREKYGDSRYAQAMTQPPATTTTMRVDPAR